MHCQSQEEADYYWDRLTADRGQESQCAWLRDKYELSWQITPDMLLKYLTDSDAARSQRVFQAMLQMKKIIIDDLEQAAAG